MQKEKEALQKDKAALEEENQKMSKMLDNWDLGIKKIKHVIDEMGA